MKRLALVVLFAAFAAVPWLHASASQPADSTVRDLWVPMLGKRGNVKTVDGRMIFTHQTNGPNGQASVEDVGRDYVTIAAGGDGRQWRYTVPLGEIELHIFR